MPKTILQINYQFNSSRADLDEGNTQAADSIAATPGLVWKIWLMNETDREAGGIYLFESREAAQKFMSSPLVQAFAEDPSLSAFAVKMFDADEEHSKVTRGPLAIPTPA